MIKLKIKAKILTTETTLLRREEQHAHKKYKLNYTTKKQKLKYHFWTNDEQQCFDNWESLRHSRVIDVAFESRATHLARAFLSGKPYSSVEKNIKNSYWQYAALRRASEIVFEYIEFCFKKDHPYGKYRKKLEAWRLENIQRSLTGLTVSQRSKNRTTAEAKARTEILLEWAGIGINSNTED